MKPQFVIHTVRIFINHMWMKNHYDMIRVPLLMFYWNGRAFPSASFSLN